MEIRKHLSSVVLAAMLLVQFSSVPLTQYQPLVVDTAEAQSSGGFTSENAMPKFGKTWIASITCRRANGTTQSFGGGDPSVVRDLVRQAIAQRGLNITPPQYSIVRTDNGTGDGAWTWNVNSGTTHMPSVNAVCTILGFDSFVSATCSDNERSGLYPNGKCNFHSPEDDNLSRFTGTINIAACQDGNDNDNDGLTDYPQDPGCSGPTDDTERDPNGPQCDNGKDDDGNGLIDYPNDPRCNGPRDPIEGPVTQCNNGVDDDGDNRIDFPQDQGCTSLSDNDESENNSVCIGITSPNSVTVNQQFQGTITMRNTGTSTWTRNALYSLNSTTPIDNTRWGADTTRIALPEQSFAPGATANFVHNFRAPSSPGTYDFDFRMIQDGVERFGATCHKTITVTAATQCNDGQDNDVDGRIDIQDPGCHTDGNATNPNSYNQNDNNEGDESQCQNNRDDDNDGRTDSQDAGCHTDNNANNPNSYNPNDNNENDEPQCANNRDDDNDGRTDAQDAGCHTDNNANNPNSYNPTDNNEGDEPACQDGRDNDGDGLVDAADPGCSDPTDNDETNPNLAQCQNGLDDDGDGRVDYPNDPGCSAPNDSTEGGDPACADRVDNDGDGLVDFPNDPGCANLADNDEGNGAIPQCRDGVDNDGDGAVDTLVNSTTSAGGFQSETADPKYGKTWLVSITCRTTNGQNVTYNQGGNAHNLSNLVRSAISAKGLNITPPNTSSNAIVRSDNATGGAFEWNDNSGVIHMPTVTAVCQLLGNSSDTYVTSTCRDNIRDAVYPNGRCNFSSPSNNLLARFVGTVSTSACSDGRDNDGDGLVDGQDSGCASPSDASEVPHDPQCSSPDDPTEADPVSQCRDGIDNDGDGAVDLADFSCQNNPNDNDEANPKAQCQDGIDNDNDGRTDITDPGCHTDGNANNPNSYNRQDNNEGDEPACSDGRDNDNDGRVDSADPGCSGPNDTNEGDEPACRDLRDNDNDGFIDMQDQGCSSPTDNDESNVLQCQSTRYASRVVAATEDYNPSLPDGAPDFQNNLLGGPGPSTLSQNDIVDFDNEGNTPGYVVVGFAPNTRIVNGPGPDFRVYVGDFLVTEPIEAFTVFVSNDGVNFTNVGSRSPSVNTTRWQRESFDFDLGGLPEARYVKIQNVNIRQNDQREGVDIDAIEILSVDCNAPQVYQCNDGVDNDGDGAVDLADFSCGNNPNDNDETNPKAQCQDGFDNDGDGRTDIADAGCHTDGNPNNPNSYNRQDNNEGDESACQDGRDNDNDGLIDSADPGCSGPTDNDESNPLPSLAIQKSGPSTVAPGQTVTYTITVNNVGSIPATNVVIHDALLATSPAQFVSGSGPTGACNFSGDDNGYHVYTCPALSSLPAGQSRQFTFTYRATSTGACGQVIRDHGVVVVPNTSIDIHTQNDALDPANGQRDLRTTMTCPAQCQDGIDNDGDGAVDLADFSCGNNPNDNDETNPKAQCQDGFDNDGDGRTDIADAGCHTDGNPNNPNSYNRQDNNEGDESQCQDGRDNDGDGLIDYPNDPGCTGPTDNDESPQNGGTLSITKAGPSTARPGDTLTYTVTVRNTSNVTINNVEVVDPGHSTNGQTVFVPGPSSQQCTAQGGGAYCQLGQMPPGTQIILTIALRTQNINCGEAINNIAIAAASFVPEVTSNNVRTNMSCPSQCSDGVDNDNDGAIDLNDFSCQNNPNGNNESTPLAQCQNGTDDDQDGLVDAGDPGCHTDGNAGNLASYNAQDNDEGPRNTPSVFITKTMTPAQMIAGQNVTYTFTVVNNGNANVQNVAVLDTFPTNLTFVSGTNTCRLNTATAQADIICGANDYAPGQSRTFTATFSVAQAGPQGSVCGTQVTNTADLQLTNLNWIFRSSTPVTSTVECQTPNFMLTKTADSQTARPGQVITYTLTATNNGTAPQQVRVADITPQGTTFQALGSTPNCAPNPQFPNRIVCPMQDFAPGQTMTYTLKFLVNAGQACGGANAISNTAQVVQGTNTVVTTSNVQSTPVQCGTQCSDGIDNDNDGKIDSVDPGCTGPNDDNEAGPTDIGISMTGPSQIPEGGIITYLVTLVNNGPDKANGGVSFRDPIPNGLEFVPFNQTQDSSSPECHVVGNEVICDNISLDVGVAAQKIFKLVFRVPASTIASAPTFFQKLFGIQPALAANLCGTTIINQVFVQNVPQGDPNAANNQSTVVTTSVQCSAGQFTITKSGPATISQGGLLTYNITATNTSISAQTVSIVDVMPTGLTFEAAGSTAGCSQVGQSIVCANQGFNNGQTKAYTLNFRVPANFACNTTVSNIATVAQNNVTIATSPTANTAVQCVIGNADLSIIKTGPASAQYGNQVTYTILVNNAGPSPISNVSFADTIPVGMTFASQNGAVSCVVAQPQVFALALNNTAASQLLNCDVGTLAAGQTKTILVTVNTTQVCTKNDTVVNEAKVNENDPLVDDNNPNNNSGQASTDLICPPAIADLGIVKTGPASVPFGTNIAYTLNVSNAGPMTATNVVVTDTVPAGLTFLSSTGNCAFAGNQVTCNLGSVTTAAPQSITLNFATPAAPAVCAPQNFTNTATVAGSTQDSTNTANNSSTVATTLTCPVVNTADVSVAKSGPANVVRGGSITYNVAVTNNGPAAATNVQFVDTVPAGLTFVTNTGNATCTLNGNQLTCVIGSMLANTTQTVSLAFNVATVANCTQSTPITNTVTVSASNDPTPNAANNTSTAATSLDCPTNQPTDIGIIKVGPPSVIRGNTITYSFVASNYGPANATGVRIQDQVPAGLTFVSSSGGNCGLSGSTINCFVGNLNTGLATDIISVTFNVPTVANCTPGATVTNTATVTSTNPDIHQPNNTSSATTTLVCPQVTPTNSDLAITKTAQSASTQYGTQAIYTVNVTNNGPAANSAVTFTDTFPTGFTYVSQTGATSCVLSSATTVTCDVGAFTATQTKQVQLTFTAPAAPAVCAPVIATNSVTVSENDPLAADTTTVNNNSSSVATTLTCPIVAPTNSDLSITKTGTSAVLYGNQMVYTMTVTNAGPAANSAVTFTDTFPTGFTYVSQTGATSCVLSSATTVTCDVGAFTSGQTKQVQITMTAPAAAAVCAPAIATNTVTVSENDANVIDPNAANNTATKATTMMCPTGTTADLAVTKTSNPTSAVYGAPIQYVIVVTNTGPSTVNNVSIVDTVPLNLAYVSQVGATACTVALPNAALNNTAASQLVSCDVGSFTSGQSKTITLTMSSTAPTSCTAGNIVNQVVVNENDPLVTELNSVNNTAQATTAMTCPVQNADLSITKTTQTTTIQRGNTISYNVIVTNSGPGNASNVVVTDTFNSNELTYVSSSSSNNTTCTLTNTNTITCTVGTLGAGQMLNTTLIFTVKTSTGTCVASSVSNQATVTSASDPVPANNSATSSTTAITCPTGTNSFTLTKTDNRSTVNTGERLRYAIVITNNDSNQLTNLTVYDTVPSGLNIVTVSDGASISGQQVTWSNITVPANSTRTLYVDADVASSSGGFTLTNTVTAGSQSATDTTSVNTNYTYNPPPPPYYNPPPPVYYPPNPNPPPPVYYPPNPNPPPVYYPTNPPPSVVYPVTGTKDVDLYANPQDTSNLQKIADGAPVQSQGFAGMVYATVVAFLAVGSAAASKFVGFGL